MAEEQDANDTDAVPVVYGPDGTAKPAQNTSSADDDVLATSPELNVLPPRKPPPPSPVQRVGEGRTSQDTVVWPRDHWVLVDAPLSPDATLDFTETFHPMGPLKAGEPATKSRLTSSKTSAARALEKDKLVSHLYFSEHVEGSGMTLVLTQGEATTLLFDKVTGDDFFVTAQEVKKAAKRSREHLAVPFVLPAPPQVSGQKQRDKMLAGPYTKMSDVVADDPKVE